MFVLLVVVEVGACGAAKEAGYREGGVGGGGLEGEAGGCGGGGGRGGGALKGDAVDDWSGGAAVMRGERVGGGVGFRGVVFDVGGVQWLHG